MMPDTHLEALSRYVDGEVDAEETREVEALLASSPEARNTLERFLLLRREIRELEEMPPDTTAPVLAAVGTLPRRSGLGLKAAVAFAAGLLAGVVFIGSSTAPPSPMAVADVPAEVIAAQSEVDSLHAELNVVERGWHPDVPERVYTGTIAFHSPESLSIDLDDHTNYPSQEWVPNHTDHVVDEDLEWSRSVARCPAEALPTCTPAEARTTATRNREPFPVTSISALDVVVPVGGFVRADAPDLVGFQSRDGREAIGVRVTAAQLAGLIEAFVGKGNWRQVHPTDPVELWLDTETLIPLGFSVYPADTPDRKLWAIRHAYVDEPGVAVLEVEWQEVDVNGTDRFRFDPAPDGARFTDSGFADGEASDIGEIDSAPLPEHMTLHRSGTIQVGSGPPVSVATWSDGRAWLKLEWTEEWSGGRLFGDLGNPTREVASDETVVYLNERGDRVAMHGDGVDAVLSGSLPTDELVTVAGRLPIEGRPVPEDWVEAASASVTDARAAVAPFLLPGSLDGFGPPAIRVEDGAVSLSYAGAGNRAFVLNQTAGETLSPPLDAGVRGVTVRGTDGRYSPERGLLEWVEENVNIGLRSTTLSLDELIEIARSLEPA